ncbi:hypothetical protein AKJ59_00830 [candidate division MSBL1 archaeon SCGC-AAA385M02]|uniref:Uncharacterized protein n=1 Tax=candidate division MSBL1 archaeon SCGC-AAA385M02 TaxID=1698287 RepID=A0A133VPZ4_9EURY|nr:hypothetical protein AKJ59_00830 [candidate division MSBL1 archaeon SCGC-AAA385M02]
MKVKLSEDWYLLSDSENYILSKRTESEKGIYYGQRTYHNNLSSVLETLLHKKLRCSQVRTLKGLVRQQNKFIKELNEIKETIIEKLK